MEQYKQDFIEFMVQAGALTFGDFTTKSGRKTPFFINTGNYRTGAHMAKLGQYYAAAIHAAFGGEVDVLFGPAYKGIPLVVAASMALHQNHGQEVAFCFNRKEAKDHGEGGTLIGHKLKDGDRVVIVEDVITAGTSIRETVPILQAAAKVKIVGLMVSVDRMERGTGPKAALVEAAEAFGFQAAPIVTIREVAAHLLNRPVSGRVWIDNALQGRIEAYLAEYGPRGA